MEATNLARGAHKLAFRERYRAPVHFFRAASLLPRVACVLTVTLLVCGLWLVLRRLSGAFGQPLNDATIVAVVAVSVVWAAAARLLWRNATGSSQQAWLQRSMDWTPTVALVLIATSIAMPGASVVAIALVCALIGLEECGASWLDRGRPILVATRHAPTSTPQRRTRLRPSLGHRAAIVESQASADILQHWTRQQCADGLEAIQGTLRVKFVSGQRLAVEHLVFCPMLATVPKLNATPLDEADCVIRATHIYRYGARMEIKLSEPCDEPCDVLVGYEVRG